MNTSRSPTATRLGLALWALTLAVGGVACGNDDAGDSAEGDPTTTTAAAAKAADTKFCRGVVAADVASFKMNGQGEPDPRLVAAAKDALAPLEKLAPEAIKNDVASAVSDATSMFDGGDEPDTFAPAMSSISSWVGDNCGFREVKVVAEEYHLMGLPDELDAGPVLLRMDNRGKQLHESMMMRLKDGEKRTTEELLALPEEEAQAAVDPMGGVFAQPGDDGTSTADLPAGRYLVICAIPVGLTPEAIAASESGGGEPELGPPHFTQGMVHELTVN